MANRLRLALLGAGIWAATAAPLAAIDIGGVQNAALDQPRINAALVYNGDLLVATTEDIFGEEVETFTVQAFFDTGASGVLLSRETAEALGLPLEPGVVFEDVGVGGTEFFNVSAPVQLRLADFATSSAHLLDDQDTYQTVYPHAHGPLRTQVNQHPADGLIGPLDVFGMPLFQGKTVIFDARPVNNITGTIDTRIYASQQVPASVPPADYHVQMSFADFSRFTQTSDPSMAPALADNPFIGANPIDQLAGGPVSEDTAGIRTTHNGATRESSFLFDTGAAASIISEGLAAEHGVTIEGTTTIQIGLDPVEVPVLYQNGAPVEDQFYLSIGGVGGSVTVAGFWLEELALPTVEGEEIIFERAPVLVVDITVADPDTGETLTLDGVFGMNFLVASGFVDARSGFPDELTAGAFDFFSYDEPSNQLGLTFNPAFIPEPHVLGMAMLGAALFAVRRRKA